MREGKPAGIIVGTGINLATPPELLPAKVAGSLREDLLPWASRNEVAAAMVREMRDYAMDRLFSPQPEGAVTSADSAPERMG